jgi:hypothetical protein
LITRGNESSKEKRGVKKSKEKEGKRSDEESIGRGEVNRKVTEREEGDELKLFERTIREEGKSHYSVSRRRAEARGVSRGEGREVERREGEGREEGVKAKEGVSAKG